MAAVSVNTNGEEQSSPFVFVIDDAESACTFHLSSLSQAAVEQHHEHETGCKTYCSYVAVLALLR